MFTYTYAIPSNGFYTICVDCRCSVVGISTQNIFADLDLYSEEYEFHWNQQTGSAPNIYAYLII